MAKPLLPDELWELNGERDAIRLFEVATGKLVRELRPASTGTSSRNGDRGIRFSPDGRLLMAREHPGRPEAIDQPQAVVWSVADGKQRLLDVSNLGAPPISPDNRALVVGNLAPGKPFFHDFLTGKDVPAKNSQTDQWRPVGSSRDGRTLAFAAPSEPNSDDYRVYLVSVPELPEPLVGTGAPNADGLALLWAGWGSDNEFRRVHAWKTFAAHPDVTVRYAREHLSPVSAAQAKRVAELIKLLDDDSPDVRDKATADLSAAAHAFEPHLTVTRNTSGAGEVKNRLTVVLRHVKEAPVPSELATALRGVDLLEKLRTAEAKELLERLAKGTPGARLTNEAAAALKRLGG